MLRFARDFCLITLPFVALSVFFFLGHLSGWGIAIAIVAAATLVYIRPRADLPDPGAAEELEAEGQAAGIGNVGGPV
jgi:hypothetical protein